MDSNFEDNLRARKLQGVWQYEEIEAVKYRSISSRLSNKSAQYTDVNLKLDDWKKKKIPGELGFRHWLGIIIFVAILYSLVVWQDSRMPPIVSKSIYNKFSEERARVLLKELTDLGPRPSGSKACEVDAFRILTKRIKFLQEKVNEINVNRFETDVQRPSGCYNLKFLSAFTLCYHKITNILVRIGPRSKPTNHSLLLNCHFDTLPDTPGATDDAVSCSIMMDILFVLSNSQQELENDVIFLFNGAEENFLQASHGFVTQHPWRHNLRAFINLEGSGSGGREILFQAGPGDSWLLKTYLDNAPHPHCSVIAQEVFQSGIIPSDTDFRVFRDYGQISGLDIAYHRNGWVYHTEFDRPELIQPGAIQRAGENVLAVTKAIIKSPYFEQPAHFNEGNKWVFFDVIGLFTVFYEVSNAAYFNAITALVVFILVVHRLNNNIYTLRDLFWAIIYHFYVFIAMFFTGVIIVGFLCIFNLTMTWYAMPELVFPLYIVPMINTGIWLHSCVVKQKYKGINAEMFQYDSVLILWTILLLFMTYKGLASSFFILLHVLFPLLRDFLIYLLGRLHIISIVTPKIVLYTQCICLTPLMSIICYVTMFCFDFFVPVMGRMGNVINPEFIIMPLSLLTAYTFILYTNNLIYISRPLNFLIKCFISISILSILIILTTRIGEPYKYIENNYRLRRIIALHSKRSIYNSNGQLTDADTGLYVVSFDYRSVKDLPEHTFLHGAKKSNCSETQDEYCRLPYYTAIHELFPPEESQYIPLPTEPNIPFPLRVEVVNRQHLVNNHLNLTIKIYGGTDKMSLHITPLNNHTIKEWSFSPFQEVKSFGIRKTYFVFMSYGYEAPSDRTFWILLQNNQENDNLEKEGLELAVATHYAHGEHQNSETIKQLRLIINQRRRTPQDAVGYWKWAITMIGGVSEIVIHQF